MKKLKLLLVLPIALMSLWSLGGMVSAADQVDVLPQCAQWAKDDASRPAACKERDSVLQDPATTDDDQNPLFGTNGAISKFINTLSLVVGIAAVIAIMAAGLRFITSGNNPQEVNVAREMVLYACIALLLAAAAQLIVRFWLFKI
jgi:hypothetical protein